MEYITPAIIAAVIIIALSRRKSVYNDFIDGASDGFKLLADIFPPLVAMLTAAAMLKASGAMEIITDFISSFVQKLGMPAEVIPLVLIRPVSGSGAIGVLSGILNDCGADSVAGRLASVICGSTETTFYCIAVYFAKTRVKYVKRAVPCAIIGDIAGVAAAVLAVCIIGL